jgi:hypothetical protein
MLTAVSAQAAPQKVEIGIQALFTPPTGWDDNDRIQAVVFGELPGGCYAVDETTVENVGANSFLIRQFATKDSSGGCAHPETLPHSMLVPITFTQVVQLGALPMGDYKLFYSQVVSGMASRVFNVAQATTSSVDSLPYANVLQQYSEDIVDLGSELKVTLKGVVNSSCYELDPNVKIEKEGDVYVLFPLVRKKEGTHLCAQVLLPFEIELNLGAPPATGPYLVHVRSQNGNALNHVVRVVQ